MSEDLGAPLAQPRTAFYPERNRQPVGCVDQALVLHHPTRHLVAQPVVHPSDIRAGIMDAVRGRLGRRAPRGEVPVSQGAKRLPLPLQPGIPTLIHPYPLVPIRGHRPPSGSGQSADPTSDGPGQRRASVPIVVPRWDSCPLERSAGQPSQPGQAGQTPPASSLPSPTQRPLTNDLIAWHRWRFSHDRPGIRGRAAGSSGPGVRRVPRQTWSGRHRPCPRHTDPQRQRDGHDRLAEDRRHGPSGCSPTTSASSKLTVRRLRPENGDANACRVG